MAFLWRINDGDPNHLPVLGCEMTGPTGHQPGCHLEGE